MATTGSNGFGPKLRDFAESVNWFLVATVLVALAAAWPLLSDPGFLNTRGGGDSPFLLQRVQQLASALADGHFPVRWMPDAAYGYGYPFFNFYAPLSIYLAAAWHFIGLSFVEAIKATQVIGFLVAAVSMFALGKRWLGSDWAGLLASAAYTLAPFHLVNVYVRGDSLAEFWAMALFPLILLLADSVTSKAISGDLAASVTAAIVLGLSYAALILSHNISALIFTPFLIFYVCIVLWSGRSLHVRDRPQPDRRPYILGWMLLAVLIGLAASAWFWLPALGERSLAQLEPVTSGYFSFTNHFRDGNLSQSGFLFDFDVADGKAFAMGLFQAVLTLIGLVVMIIAAWRPSLFQPGNTQRSGRPVALVFLFTSLSLILATLMITSLSRPLWNSLPLLEFVQFPWRFLSVQAFAGALSAAALALLPYRRILVPALLLLLLWSSLSSLDPDFIGLDDQDVTAAKLAEYEWFTGNIGSTVSAEYLPESVLPRPFTSRWLDNDLRDDLRVLRGEVTSARLLERDAARQAWHLDVSTPGTVVMFPIYFWPGWIAKIDGTQLEPKPAPGSGLMTLEVPSGEQEIELVLRNTPVRQAADILSLVAVVSVLILLARYLRPQVNWRAVLAAAALVLFVAIFLLIQPAATASKENLTWDFSQLAYLHHEKDGVLFQDGSILDSYAYDSESTLAGESISITLDWSNPGERAVIIQLTTPATNRFDNAPIIAEQRQDEAEERMVFEIPVPENAPSGLVIPRLLIEGTDALTSSGDKRGDLFLRPLRIVDQIRPETTEGSLLDARPVKVGQQEADILDVQLEWLSRTALTHDYNFSLRLVDGSGMEIASIDSQPGFGFQPSSNWTESHWIDDWLSLTLPSDLEETLHPSPYALVVRLYEVDNGEVVLLRRLGEIERRGSELVFNENEPRYDVPDLLKPAAVTFADVIVLRGYELQQTEGELKLVLYWQALEGNLENYSHFVHLLEAGNGNLVRQHDSIPRVNTYPTSQWSEGEVVADPAELDLSLLQPGEYVVAVGLYQDLGAGSEPDRYRRLQAADSEGKLLADNRLILPFDLIIEEN